MADLSDKDLDAAHRVFTAMIDAMATFEGELAKQPHARQPASGAAARLPDGSRPRGQKPLLDQICTARHTAGRGESAATRRAPAPMVIASHTAARSLPAVSFRAGSRVPHRAIWTRRATSA